MKPYDDNTILTIGKYKFTKLSRVPSEYLLNLHKNNNKSDKLLFEYVDQNIEKIKSRIGIKYTATVPCEKVMYCSEKLAKDVLRKISIKEQDHKKPQRAYECEKCGAWHLTSIPFEKWEKKTINTKTNEQRLNSETKSEHCTGQTQ